MCTMCTLEAGDCAQYAPWKQIIVHNVHLGSRCPYLQRAWLPRDAWSLHAAAGDDKGLHLPLYICAAAPYGGTRGRTRGGTHCGGNGGKNAGLFGCTRRDTHDVSFAETHGRTLGGIIVRNWRVL